MSIKVISLIWEEHRGFLTGTEKSVLIRLADFGSDNGQQIFPGINRISEDTGFSRATIKRTIKSLSEKKILTKRNRKSKVQFITNLYSINVKLLQQLSKLPPVDKYAKNDEGGRVTVNLPRVTENRGGRVTVNPDPLLNKPLLNNNKEPALITDGKAVDKQAVVVCLKEERMSLQQLLDFEIEPNTAKMLASQYSEKAIRSKIALCKATPSVRNKAGWLIRALQQDFSNKPSSQSPKPGNVATIEETRAILESVDKMVQGKSKKPSPLKEMKEQLLNKS